NVLAQRAALAALKSKKEWLPGIRRICGKNQEMIRGAVGKVDGTSLPVYPSKANMFVIDLASTGVNPEVVEERLLFDHLVHTRAGSYLSKKHGGKFLRVSFTVSEADCKRFAESFPVVMDKLGAPPFSVAPTIRLAIRPLPGWLKARTASPKARGSLPP